MQASRRLRRAAVMDSVVAGSDPAVFRLSRCITTLPSNRTTSPPPVILSRSEESRPVEQFDVDMFVGRHVPLVHVDNRLAEPRFIARRGLQKDILVQVEQLVLGVHQAVARIQRDGRTGLPSTSWRAGS